MRAIDTRSGTAERKQPDIHDAGEDDRRKMLAAGVLNKAGAEER
jgi:hypothetical protein